MTTTGGAVGDAGAGTWGALVYIGTDGGATGEVRVSMPDVPVDLIYSDGGPGGSGYAYLYFQKQ